MRVLVVFRTLIGYDPRKSVLVVWSTSVFFLFLALYIIKFTEDHGLGTTGGGGMAVGLWFGETWGYTIILSVIYGAVVGWIAKELLHLAEERRYVDRESFLVFAITLAVSNICVLLS